MNTKYKQKSNDSIQLKRDRWLRGAGRLEALIHIRDVCIVQSEDTLLKEFDQEPGAVGHWVNDRLAD